MYHLNTTQLLGSINIFILIFANLTLRFLRKLEDFVVCSRLLYDPKREGIPLDCMHPQKPDWRILGLREAPPNGITAYQHHQNMKASLEANREGNSAATTTRQTAAAEKRKSSQHLHSNRQVVKKTKRSERAVSEPTNMSRNTGADAPVPITRVSLRE